MNDIIVCVSVGLVFGGWVPKNFSTSRSCIGSYECLYPSETQSGHAHSGTAVNRSYLRFTRRIHKRIYRVNRKSSCYVRLRTYVGCAFTTPDVFSGGVTAQCERNNLLCVRHKRIIYTCRVKNQI